MAFVAILAPAAVAACAVLGAIAQEHGNNCELMGHQLKDIQNQGGTTTLMPDF